MLCGKWGEWAPGPRGLRLVAAGSLVWGWISCVFLPLCGCAEYLQGVHRYDWGASLHFTAVCVYASLYLGLPSLDSTWLNFSK